MPSFLCRCGKQLRYGEIPNPIEWLLISDVEYDDFTGMVDAETIYKKMRSMMVCPNCSRLWIFWRGFGESPISYCEEKSD